MQGPSPGIYLCSFLHAPWEGPGLGESLKELAAEDWLLTILPEQGPHVLHGRESGQCLSTSIKPTKLSYEF